MFINETKTEKRWYQRWWALAIIFLFALYIGMSLIPDGNTDTAEPTAQVEEDTTAEPEEKFDASKCKLIGYDKLARNPDKYIGRLIKNTGTVIQVLEGDTENNLRVAIDDDYDKVMMIGYDPSIIDSRVLEDDTITFYGSYIGIYDYESTIGGQISVPAVFVEKIKIH